MFQNAMSGLTSGVKSFLPSFLSDVVEPPRKFAFVKLKETVGSTVAGFFDNSSLMVIDGRGVYARYIVPTEGGECVVKKEEANLLAADVNEEALAATASVL